MWRAGKESRIDEERPMTPMKAADREDTSEAVTGTPTRSVKFALGYRRASNRAVAAGSVGNTDASGGASALGSTRTSGVAATSVEGGRGNTEGQKKDAKDPRAAVMNVTVQARLWADYFNNTLRCWEALLDPFR